MGINPFYFSLALFGYLVCFVIYLLLPRGVRKLYCGALPKRYEWSAKPRRRRNPSSGAPPTGPSGGGHGNTAPSNALYRNPFKHGSGSIGSNPSNRRNNTNHGAHNHYPASGGGGASSSVQGSEYTGSGGGNHHAPSHANVSSTSLEKDAALSTAMNQLRDPGVLIVAHGSRGKPKTVRLQLSTDCITWRTESRKKNSSGHYTKELKLGKLHSVALNNIMYVDVGKQTTALRRKENDSVPETLCFSLLTKEGSLDLESNSPRERDALVSCFSLVLDDVHAQNWRDIYRGPSDGQGVPSSFDEYDEEQGRRGGGGGN